MVETVTFNSLRDHSGDRMLSVNHSGDADADGEPHLNGKEWDQMDCD